MPKTLALSNLRTFACDATRLLSELICLMKFCYHRTAFERRVLRAGGALCVVVVFVTVVVVSRTMISVSNTCL